MIAMLDGRFFDGGKFTMYYRLTSVMFFCLSILKYDVNFSIYNCARCKIWSRIDVPSYTTAIGIILLWFMTLFSFSSCYPSVRQDSNLLLRGNSVNLIVVVPLLLWRVSLYIHCRRQIPLVPDRTDRHNNALPKGQATNHVFSTWVNNIFSFPRLLELWRASWKTMSPPHMISSHAIVSLFIIPGAQVLLLFFHSSQN